MKTLDNFHDTSACWAHTSIDVGTRFSLIATRTEIVTMPQTKASPCEFCVLQDTKDTPNPIRQHITCGYLPDCSGLVFVPCTPEAMAKYTAWRLSQ